VSGAVTGFSATIEADDNSVNISTDLRLTQSLQTIFRHTSLEHMTIQGSGQQEDKCAFHLFASFKVSHVDAGNY
jgi:hypothetical protein